MRSSWLVAAGVSVCAAMCAGGTEPPADPILRIDAGMHTAVINRIAVDARGRWLVTASDDKTARVWDLKTGRLQRVLRPPVGPGPEGKVYAVALSPDGATVAAGGWTQFNNGGTDPASDGNAIYLFDRGTGRVWRRLGGLLTIDDLAFSPNGRYLAATMGDNGVRVYRTDTWELVGRDSDYGDSSNSADFSRDGRLVTACDDGFIRLYRVSNSGLALLTKQTATDGKRPYSVRFSPDGRLIAVGFGDSPAVDVLDGSTLALRYAPRTPPVNRAGWAVAWSADNQTLFAQVDDEVIRRWPNAGQGAPRDTHAAEDTVLDLRALPQGGVAFGSSDPAWGLVDAGGHRTRFVAGPIVDFRGIGEHFQLASDARTVRFSYTRSGDSPARFDPEHGLTLDEDTANPLTAPRTKAPGLIITDWFNTRQPKLNGKLLPLRFSEHSRSLAIAPDGEHFALGADYYLRLYDRSGKERWRVDAPGPTWAVNISGDGQTVVTAFSDGTIRWFDIRDGREELAFFPHADRKRWVAWTPSGYYYASPGGEDLIGWQLNHGKDTAADFFPASRFRSKFNRPDVIARAVSAPSEAEALRLADAEGGRKPAAGRVSVQTLLPPVVEILSPRDGTSVVSSSVTVRYTARSPTDAPVTGLRVRVNGQAVTLSENRDLGVSASGNVRAVTIPIRAEDSEIQLFAENKNGVSTPAILRVSWAGGATASAPETIFKPKLYVLSVGVAHYANASFNLGLPAKDARDFASVLMKQKGRLYADVQVRLLTDTEATKDNVLDGLDWLRHAVTQHDVAMMFLAGHGMNDSYNTYYFLPYNADPEKLFSTGVPQSAILEALGTVAGKAVFFVDTCHSGNALGTARARGFGNDINSFVSDLAAAENGVVVFTASTGRQSSLEDPAWGNGAFTKAVVEGLSGKADLQRSGSITLKGLDYYIDGRVKELTGGRQSPVSIAPSGVADFPIAVVVPAALVSDSFSSRAQGAPPRQSPPAEGIAYTMGEIGRRASYGLEGGWSTTASKDGSLVVSSQSGNPGWTGTILPAPATPPYAIKVRLHSGLAPVKGRAIGAGIMFGFQRASGSTQPTFCAALLAGDELFVYSYDGSGFVQHYDIENPRSNAQFDTLRIAVQSGGFTIVLNTNSFNFKSQNLACSLTGGLGIVVSGQGSATFRDLDVQ
jgi:WD40 repeat protein